MDDKKVNTSVLADQVKEKYAHAYLAQRIDQMAVELLEVREDWKSLQEILPAYMENYEKLLTPDMLNYYAWLVNEYLTDPTLITTALSWSERSIKATDGQNTLYLETYANLLRKAEAVNKTRRTTGDSI